MLLLSPLPSQEGRRARLQRILLERSRAGVSYMEGGALGWVSAGLDHQMDSGATLAIREDSRRTVDRLMKQLDLGITLTVLDSEYMN